MTETYYAAIATRTLPNGSFLISTTAVQVIALIIYIFLLVLRPVDGST
jgi:hypothetical protein